MRFSLPDDTSGLIPQMPQPELVAHTDHGLLLYGHALLYPEPLVLLCKRRWRTDSFSSTPAIISLRALLKRVSTI